MIILTYVDNLKVGPVQKEIIKFFDSFMRGSLKWAINALKETVKIMNTHLSEIDLYYSLFLGVATSFVIAVVLARVIGTMLKQADDTTDVTWANIIMDSIKSAASIPVMVFIQGFFYRAITLPVLTFALNQSEGFSMKTVDHATDVVTGKGSGYGFGVPLLLMAFFLVIMLVFFVKMGVFIAEIGFFNISIPFVAVSIASENYDYSGTWWKKYLFVNITLMAQVIAMSLMVFSFGLLDKGWGFIAVTIGFGALVVKAPALMQDMWQGSGTGALVSRKIARMANLN